MAAALIIAMIITLLAALCGVMAWREYRTRLHGRPRSAADIRARLDRADQEVTAAWRATRRAMNDAVGQSWRNLTD